MTETDREDEICLALQVVSGTRLDHFMSLVLDSEYYRQTKSLRLISNLARIAESQNVCRLTRQCMVNSPVFVQVLVSTIIDDVRNVAEDNRNLLSLVMIDPQMQWRFFVGPSNIVEILFIVATQVSIYEWHKVGWLLCNSNSIPDYIMDQKYPMIEAIREKFGSYSLP